MPFCRVCGAGVGEGASFCGSCGATLGESGQRLNLQDSLVAAAAAFPAPLEPQKDGSLAMEALVAERKAFLSSRKLTYKCRLRVNDGVRSVTFWEMLVERSSGVSGGMSGGDDMAPGFGFKKETYSTGGRERSGSIEEASRLFGKDFVYSWDYTSVRGAIRGMAEAAGYRLDVVLDPRSV